jgi:SAM-dependent methyltransferase
MLKKIRNYLVDPRILNIDRDGEDRILIHNQILSSKKMMRDVFKEFYLTCISIADNFFCKDGDELEIGAGVSFFKKIRPKLIVTDRVFAPHLDYILDAQNMVQIDNSSLRSIYAMNVFHHIPNPREFFKELGRVLKPGGGCILIEPFYGPVARHFFNALHASEHYNHKQSAWEAKESMGVMSNANQALSYIVFERDRDIFLKEFPEFEIVVSRPLQNYLRYLCSGGINFRQLLPDFCTPILRTLEFFLWPLCRVTALHHVIAIRKKPVF